MRKKNSGISKDLIITIALFAIAWFLIGFAIWYDSQGKQEDRQQLEKVISMIDHLHDNYDVDKKEIIPIHLGKQTLYARIYTMNDQDGEWKGLVASLAPEKLKKSNDDNSWGNKDYLDLRYISEAAPEQIARDSVRIEYWTDYEFHCAGDDGFYTRIYKGKKPFYVNPWRKTWNAIDQAAENIALKKALEELSETLEELLDTMEELNKVQQARKSQIANTTVKSETPQENVISSPKVEPKEEPAKEYTLSDLKPYIQIGIDFVKAHRTILIIVGTFIAYLVWSSLNAPSIEQANLNRTAQMNNLVQTMASEWSNKGDFKTLNGIYVSAELSSQGKCEKLIISDHILGLHHAWCLFITVNSDKYDPVRCHTIGPNQINFSYDGKWRGLILGTSPITRTGRILSKLSKIASEIKV